MNLYTDNDISELAASPQGRDTIRYAVESYRQSMDQFTQGVSGLLNGRSVIYNYTNHCFHQSKYANVPIESVQALWEKDHLIYAVAKFAKDLFSDMDGPVAEQNQMDLIQKLKEKYIKVVIQNDCPTSDQLARAKSRMDEYLNKLLEKACAFEAASTSLSVPGHWVHATSLSGPFPGTTIVPDGWDRELTTTFGPDAAEKEDASSSVSTDTYTEEETSRSDSSGKNLFVLFLIHVRKVILTVFNWFIDQFV